MPTAVGETRSRRLDFFVSPKIVVTFVNVGTDVGALYEDGGTVTVCSSGSSGAGAGSPATFLRSAVFLRRPSDRLTGPPEQQAS